MWELCVGPVRIQRIVELENLTVPATWLLANIEEFRPDLTHFEVNVQSFLIRTPDNTILVDTGCGNGRRRPGQPLFDNLQTDFLGKLRACGVDPQDIDLVILTHLHFDHVGWNTSWVDGRGFPTFPNARYLFSRQEFEFWEHAQRVALGSEATRQSFRDSVVPIVEAGLARFLEDLDEIRNYDAAIGLFALPGHTPFQFGVSITDDDRTVLIVADALHSPLQIGEPRLYNGGDIDREGALQTRTALIRRALASGAILLGSHIGGMTAGRIVPTGNGPRFDFIG